MRFFFIILFTLLSFSKSASAQELDSTLMLTLSSFDTIKLDNRAAFFLYGKKINALERKVTSLKLIELAKKMLDASTNLPNTESYKDSISYKTSALISLLYGKISDKQQSKEYIELALKYAKSSQTKRFIVEAYIALGAIYTYEENKLTKGVNAFLLALEEIDTMQVPYRFIISTYINLSNCYLKLGETSEAIQYLKRAETFHTGVIDDKRKTYNLSTVYSGLSQVYNRLENKDSTAFYINKLITSTKALERQILDHSRTKYLPIYFDENIKDNYIYITNYYLKKEELEKAKIYYSKVNSFTNLDVYKKYLLDLNFAVKFNNSIQVKLLLNKPPEDFDIHGNKDYLEIMATFYEQSGLYKKSLDFTKQYYNLKNKELKSERIKLSDYTDYRIESIKNRKVIDILERDQAYQRSFRQFLFVLFSLALLLLVVLIYFYRQKQEKNKILKENLERKKVIENQTQKIQQAEEQKKKLFINIAHELQTPLNIIKGFSNQIYKTEKLTDEGVEAIGIIIKNSKYLSRITNQILEINLPIQKQITTEFVLISLKELLDYILPEFQFLAKEKSINLISPDFKNLKVLIFSDVDKIETILKNLLSNAIKFTPIHGTVKIEYIENNDGYLQIIINNNGRGILQEEFTTLFERYNQSKMNIGEGGYGLGLAICKEYIEFLNGKIEVTSELGVSTTFMISHPIVSKEILGKNEELYRFPQIQYPTTLKQSVEKINYLLIVEDNIDFCKYLATVFDKKYDLVFVHNGQQAITYLEMNKPDLILTDWMMPEMNGIQLVEYLKSKEAYLDIPILMLTSRNLAIDKMNGLRKGIDDFLVKSVDEEVLRNRVAYLLKIKNAKETFLLQSFTSKNNEIENQTLKIDQEWLLKVEESVIPLIADFDLNLEKISNLLDISSMHLNRKVKKITGLTAKKYIQEIRYWEARKMLEENEYDSVKAVCFSVGFKDPKNFSRKFKERFGAYPSDFL